MAKNMAAALVILAMISVAALTSPTRAEVAAGAVQQLDNQKFLLPFNPDIEGCWKAVLDTEGCVGDLFTSLLTFRIQLSANCCKAILSVGDKCFHEIFSSYPFNAFFPHLLQGFCASSGVATPPPHAATPPPHAATPPPHAAVKKN